MLLLILLRLKNNYFEKGLRSLFFQLTLTQLKPMKSLCLTAFAILLFLCSCNTESKTSKTTLTASEPVMFVGTYTETEGHVDGQGEGIYTLHFEDGDLEASSAQLAGDGITNPTFITLSPDGNYLYSVSELSGKDGDTTGYVVAYKITNQDSLIEIDRKPSRTLAPAHISIDQTGSLVFTANYVGGVVMVYERLNDGTLEAVQQLTHEGTGPHARQESSHVHMAKVSPDNKYLYIPDLGSDKIWSYKIDLDEKQLSPTKDVFTTTAPGAGPRHMGFHPSREYAWAINELNNTITAYSYDAKTGSLDEIESVTTLPADFTEFSATADIHVHPNGKFIYGSNRGHDSIVGYRINEKSGELSFISYTSTRGEFPRNFAIGPEGKRLYAANQNSDTITVYDIDTDTGELTYTGTTLQVPTPVSIVFKAGS
ncbi:MAG: lactonase family protein [Balneolaceae bacterium]|nr:lactonase family protein [Balneolaceae bacterium]